MLKVLDPAHGNNWIRAPWRESKEANFLFAGFCKALGITASVTLAF